MAASAERFGRQKRGKQVSEGSSNTLASFVSPNNNVISMRDQERWGVKLFQVLYAELVSYCMTEQGALPVILTIACVQIVMIVCVHTIFKVQERSTRN
jgi:hypothetical protein